MADSTIDRLLYAKSLNGKNDSEMLRISDSISTVLLQGDFDNNSLSQLYLSAYLKSRVLNRQGKLNICQTYLDSIISKEPQTVSENYGNLFLIKGIVNKKLANTQASLQNYSRAIQIFEETSSCKSLVKARNNLANYYNSLSLYEEAIVQYKWCIDILNECPNTYQKAVINRNLAGLYFNFEKKPKKAIELFREALNVFQKLDENQKNAQHIVGILNQLTFLHLYIKNIDESAFFVLEAEKYLTKYTSVDGKYNLDLNKANLFKLQKKFSKSNELFNNLEKEIESNSNLSIYQPRFYIEFSEFLIQKSIKQNSKKIFKLLNKADSLAKEQSKIEIQSQVALLKSRVYNTLNQHQIAYNELLKHKDFNNQLINAEKIRVLQSKKHQLQFIEQENKRQKEKLEQQKIHQKNMLDKNKLEKQNLRIIVIGLVVFAILIGILFWLYSLKKKSSINKLKLEADNNELELKLSNHEREEEYKLFQKSIESKKEEQNRISRNLHDNIGANLAAIKLALDDEKDSVFGKLIDDVYQEVRNLSYELNELSESKDLFHQMIQAYLNNIATISGISIHYEVYPNVDFEKMQSVQKREIFSIIRELVNNSLTHSKTKNMEIIFSKDQDNIHLYFEDFGIGFDVSKIKPGLGLSNIQKRVSILDGNFELDARINRGVIINIEIPL
ncbi:MAG: ATP-binding protein [Flavobacteriales bacterium]